MCNLRRCLVNGGIEKVIEEDCHKTAYEKFNKIVNSAFDTSFPLVEIEIKYNNKMNW